VWLEVTICDFVIHAEQKFKKSCFNVLLENCFCIAPKHFSPNVISTNCRNNTGNLNLLYISDSQPGICKKYKGGKMPDFIDRLWYRNVQITKVENSLFRLLYCSWNHSGSHWMWLFRDGWKLIILTMKILCSVNCT
jgi:hypothetical protein